MRKPWRHAEKYFEAAGAHFGATCTKPEWDDHGWDYFVEFPRADNPKLPLDMVAAPFKCFVQIKSTKSATATRLKLSNALEFSKLDMPCFNVLFVYEKGALTPTHAVVHHFWENEIRQTLFRARQLDACGQRKAHKARIALSSETGHKIGPDGVFDFIFQTIKGMGAHYGDKKRLLADTLGFEETNAVGNITYGEGVTLDDIVDLHIGLKPELPISHFRFTSVRFGIASSKPTADVQRPGILTTTSTPHPCELLISSESGGARVKLDANMYLPGIPDLPMENMKARVVADFAEATFAFGTSKCDFKFNFEFDRHHEIAAALARTELLAACASTNVSIRVFANGVELFSGGGSTEAFPKDGVELIAPVLEFLRHLDTRETDIRTRYPPKIRLADLFQNHRRLATYQMCVSGRNMIASATFDWIGDAPVGPAICYYLATAPLGDFALCTIVRRECTIGTTIDGRTSVTMGPIVYTRPHVFDEQTAYLPTMIQEIERLSEHIKDLPVLVLGDVFDSIPEEPRTLPLLAS